MVSMVSMLANADSIFEDLRLGNIARISMLSKTRPPMALAYMLLPRETNCSGVDDRMDWRLRGPWLKMTTAPAIDSLVLTKTGPPRAAIKMSMTSVASCGR